MGAVHMREKDDLSLCSDKCVAEYFAEKVNGRVEYASS